MSLILEALKKSEQQRRLGEAPTFGSPVVATRRRRRLLPVLAVLIVIAAGAGWWMLRRSSSPAPPVPSTTAAADASSVVAETPIKRDAHATAAAANAVNRAKLAETALQKSEQEKRAAALANAPRAMPPAAPAATSTPPKTAALSQPPPTAPVATPPKSAGAATAPTPAAPTVVDKSAGLHATAPATAVAPPTSAAQKPDPTTPAAAPPNAKSAAAPAQATKPAPAAAALPTIWDLPFATRKDIPALDLSMHVYSADPKQRFVVLKGNRHVEGDEVADGLTLREIRQDGLVLEYKGQKFFFPRTGR